MRSTIFLLFLPVVLAGCLTQAPTISVDSTEIVARNHNAMAVHFNLLLTNNNNKPIEPLEFTYNVNIEGRRVYSGRHAAEMSLAEGGQDRPLALPAVVRFDQFGWSLVTLPVSLPWSLSGSLVYVNEGVLAKTLLDLGYRPSTSFSAEGTMVTNATGTDPSTGEPLQKGPTTQSSPTENPEGS